MRATGSFQVQLTPRSSDSPGEGVPLGQMDIAKSFTGDLAGTSAGTMLAAVTAVKGSAAYVALERFSGTLHGRAGTFVLQHRGVMDRGAQSLQIEVVPDSGTGELAGLSGRFELTIVDGRHDYVLDYALPG